MPGDPDSNPFARGVAVLICPGDGPGNEGEWSRPVVLQPRYEVLRDMLYFPCRLMVCNKESKWLIKLPALELENFLHRIVIVSAAGQSPQSVGGECENWLQVHFLITNILGICAKSGRKMNF